MALVEFRGGSRMGIPLMHFDRRKRLTNRRKLEKLAIATCLRRRDEATVPHSLPSGWW